MKNKGIDDKNTPGRGLEYGSLDEMIGVELRNSQVRAEKYFSDHCPVKILPGHFTILKLIHMNPGQNQSVLAAAARLDRSSMVPIIDHFEKQGWVVRQPFSGDRRAYALKITGKGESVLLQTENYVDELEQRITAVLGDDNRQQLLQSLRQLQEAFQE